MKILIVEDDYLQSEWLSSQIQPHLNNASVEIIETELEFRNNLGKIESNLPNIILMDIMLRWTNPSPAMTRPPFEIEQEGIYYAGFRCQELLMQSSKAKGIPVIFYSVLDKSDLAAKLSNLKGRTVHMIKDSDVSPLVREIMKMTA